MRPKVNSDGSMGFELQDGIFKRFVERARKNYEDSQKSQEIIEKEVYIQKVIDEFFSGIELGVTTFNTVNGNEFTITDVDETYINIHIPGNASSNKVTLNIAGLKKMLESDQKFDKIKDVTSFFGNSVVRQEHSYYFVLYKKIKDIKSSASKTKVKQEELKKYIFIIDEINRGNMGKILGELFMLIEKDKRGPETQLRLLYSGEMFYVPENLYIIGTMNTADRSLAMMDYALRRRFSFFEIRPAFDRSSFGKNSDKWSPEFRRLVETVRKLNETISDDASLGRGFCVGHSYLCAGDPSDASWLESVIQCDIVPLLEEYWFDEPDKVDEWKSLLLGAVK